MKKHSKKHDDDNKQGSGKLPAHTRCRLDVLATIPHLEHGRTDDEHDALCLRVRTEYEALRYTPPDLHAAQRALVNELCKERDKIGYWPRRDDGQPWSRCSDMLLALPQWTPTQIKQAFVRLVAEGLAELHGKTPSHARLTTAGVLRTTSTADGLDELTRLTSTPEGRARVLAHLATLDGGAQ